MMASVTHGDADADACTFSAVPGCHICECISSSMHWMFSHCLITSSLNPSLWTSFNDDKPGFFSIEYWNQRFIFESESISGLLWDQRDRSKFKYWEAVNCGSSTQNPVRRVKCEIIDHETGTEGYNSPVIRSTFYPKDAVTGWSYHLFSRIWTWFGSVLATLTYSRQIISISELILVI